MPSRISVNKIKISPAWRDVINWRITLNRGELLGFIFRLAVLLAAVKLELLRLLKDKQLVVYALEEVNYRAVGECADDGANSDADELAKE